jgi:hypothetical protein
MKYILLMTGTRAGVDTYRAWNKNDIDTHMAGLKNLVKHLRESGEYIADQGLTGPEEAKVVRGQKKDMPITDGIFPGPKPTFTLQIRSNDEKGSEKAGCIG